MWFKRNASLSSLHSNFYGCNHTPFHFLLQSLFSSIFYLFLSIITCFLLFISCTEPLFQLISFIFLFSCIAILFYSFYYEKQTDAEMLAFFTIRLSDSQLMEIFMKKKEFLIYNDLLFSLYTCTTYQQLQKDFLPQLKLLIPCSYSSFVLASPDTEDNSLSLHTPLCYPDIFQKAEETYCKYAKYDELLWLVRRHDYTVVKESDLINDEDRLGSIIYQKCYREFDIFDTMQDFIVWQGKMLGVLTLFRKTTDAPFTEENLFYLKALSRHLNSAMNRILSRNSPDNNLNSKKAIRTFAGHYQLSTRETEILRLVCRFFSNSEIADSLGIRENTVQKHLQNIFRKCQVSSRWELLRSFTQTLFSS